LEALVYVLNQRGEPLMPCSPSKGKKLLKNGKAEIVERLPFTIKLTIATGETKQAITLGVDGGYLHIGLSALTEKKELFSLHVQLRKDLVKLLSERRNYRKSRRNRKLWHRESRYLNRKKPSGWLSPSIKHKYESHRRIIEKTEKILPLRDIVIEVANFDIQKIKNPEISGKEYQKGEQEGFWNRREYVLHRDNHICRECKGNSKDTVLEVHHILSRQTEGNRPDNLITLCSTCHRKISQGKMKLNVTPSKGYREATFMTTIRWKLVNALKEEGKNVRVTYGYITKHNRIEAELPKSHINDAFIIAGGKEQSRCQPFCVIQRRKHNRSIQKNRKGFKPSIRKKNYPYHPGDLVGFDGKIFSVKGVFNYGKWIRLVDKKGEIKNIATKKIELVKYGAGFCFEY